MPLWIKDGIGTPGGGLVTPSTSHSVRRWSFLGPVLPPRVPAIDDIYSNNNGKIVVVAAGPASSSIGKSGATIPLRWCPLPDPLAAPPRDPAIDVFYNFGGGRCRTRQQHPPGGPPSMSSTTSVVTAIGATGSTPRAAIDIFYNFDSGRCRTHWHPPRGCH
jgi:hypothetical protein